PAPSLAAGLLGSARQLLACPDPTGQPPDAGLLLDAASGKSRPLKLGCPIAWAARAGVFAGAAGAWPAVEGFRRAATVPKGGSVLVGRPGKAPRVLLDAKRLRRLAGKGAVVDGLALSPDAKLVAVSAGRPGGPWQVLVLEGAAPRVTSIPLAPGHRPAWIGWSDRQGSTALAVAAVDRRGGPATSQVAAPHGGGGVLACQ